jgi:phosphate transport system protein
MTKHLQDDLGRLKKELLLMGALVEDAINKAISSIVKRDPELARSVLKGDDAIDQKELQVEDLCLKILALHQPVASDLRFLVATIKVNNDLERMGDHAQSIAERSLFLSEHRPIDVHIDFQRLLEKARGMVKQSLDALVNSDARAARGVCAQDAEVDALNRHMFVVLEDLMRRDSGTIERAVQTLSVARNLERIADLATNIAEDIVFMVEGEVIRHRSKLPAAPTAQAGRGDRSAP